MILIDGKLVAEAIEERVKQTLLNSRATRPPGLAFILVGENPASRTYIEMKKRKCAAVGILSFDRELPGNTDEVTLLATIEKLNQDPGVDGILIQLPLPAHLSTLRAISAVDPSKDVDGFHPVNFGKLLLGESHPFPPCTPQGVIALLHHYKIPINGRHVVIVGRSNIVGKPLAAMLMQKNPQTNATVTVAHSGSTNLMDLCQSADILIVAAGYPSLIDARFVKPGAAVIDVGINKVSGKLVGDVDFDSVAKVAGHLTPVPGGVGPMTIAMLLANTLASYQKKC